MGEIKCAKTQVRRVSLNPKIKYKIAETALSITGLLR